MQVIEDYSLRICPLIEFFCLAMSNQVVEIQRYRVNRNAWKSNLVKEIVAIEDNLDKLYQIVGIKPVRVVSVEVSELDENSIVTSDQRLKSNETSRSGNQPENSYEALIDKHFQEIEIATDNLCSLITAVTEFDIPIPVQILLKLASRLTLLKWLDYKKKIAGSMSKKYVYSKSPNLVLTGLNLFKWISVVVGTDILPFQPYINQNLHNILVWTRASNLMLSQDGASYYAIRSHIFEYISLMSETLSTNINLEPKQLANLIDVEILGTIQDCHFSDYVTEALECLERLFVIYADFLDAPHEHKIKSFVVGTCLRVYRDFDKNVIGLAVRRQLIKLLETLGNRPYASTTTELAWHIFELAERLEYDAEIKFIARRSIKVGMAHRPTIVSNYGVYSSHLGGLLPVPASLTNGISTDNGVDEQLNTTAASLEQPTAALTNGNGVTITASDTSASDAEATRAQVAAKAVLEGEQESVREAGERQERAADTRATGEQATAIAAEAASVAPSPTKQKKPRLAVNEKPSNGPAEPCESSELDEEEQDEKPEDDPQVQSYLSLFVDKPASQIE